MNKSRKTITLVLFALAAFSFIACTNSVDDSGDSNGSKKSKKTPYKIVGIEEINGVTYDIVEFGSFPQSQIEDGVTVDVNTSKDAGMYTYYKGSDGEWYVYFKDVYYKVEPIRWRVLTKNYNNTGKELLLAQKILMPCDYYEYQDTNRIIEGKTIYPNNYEHSRVRAYLNGLSYYTAENEDTNPILNDEFNNNGFLQTAFSPEELKVIKDTVVDNSKKSLVDAQGKQKTSDTEDYSCPNTTDKIFLLSENEATTESYGFAAYITDFNSKDKARQRSETNFSRVNYYYSVDGSWWIRSPAIRTSFITRFVTEKGYPNGGGNVDVHIGLVPALCVD